VSRRELSGAEIFEAVEAEITRHREEVSGFSATLSEFEGRLIAGRVLQRLGWETSPES
jgi:hypothetical protein